jgi:predicted metalloprotease
VGAYPRRTMSTRRRVGGSALGMVALALVAMAVVASCAGLRAVETMPARPTSTAPDTSSDATVPVTTAPGSPPVFVDDPNRPPQPYDEALSAAFLDIEAYWRTTFPQLYGGRFEELRGGIWPVYRGRRGVPGCGQAQTRYSDIQGNAFYCPDGDFVAFDDTDLFPTLYGRFGPEVLAMIVAHEWGHAVQARAGTMDLPAIVLEQQADCFAGAWMAHMATDGGPFTVNDATLNIAFAGMLTFRDTPGTSAQHEGAHGSGFDRVGAFQDGFTNRAEQCATYATNPPPVLEFGFSTQQEADSGGNLSLAEIVPSTVQDLDTFWKGTFDALGKPYSAPAGGLQPYASAGPYPTCPSVSADSTFYVGRVWYCTDRDFIAFDEDAVSGPIYEVGDFAVSILLANAWTDAMMTRLGINLSGKERSLESDCLTGVWTRSTLPGQHEGQDRLTLSPGDLDEAVIAFLRYGGGEGSGTDEVGTVFERIESFRRGVLQGGDGCGLK